MGQSLLDQVATVAEASFGAKKYADAARQYQQAAAVATTIHSKRAAAFKTPGQVAQQRVDAAKKANSLETAVSADPANAAAMKSLVMHLIVEMDDARSAAAHLHDLNDETLKKMVPLAAKDAGSLAPDDLRQLGDWYKGLAFDAGVSLSGKAYVFARAATCYGRFLDRHAKHDLESLTAQKSLDQVADELKKMGLPQSDQADESLGTWQVQRADQPDRTMFIEFHRGGKAEVTTLYPETERAGKPALPFAMISLCTWKDDGKSVDVSNGWSLPRPLGTKFTFEEGFGKTVGATLGQVSRSTPSATLRKLAGGAKSTKIPGMWDLPSSTWQFLDDGTALRTTSSESSRVIYLAKWKIDHGQFTFSTGHESYSFSYPLTQGENRGKQSIQWAGRTVEAMIILKPHAQAKE